MAEKYAIVQHTAALTEHTEFAHAVESRGCTLAEAGRVVANGGVVFDSYGEAEAFCETENYQPSGSWLIPRGPGSFAPLYVLKGVHKVYVPVRVRA